MTERFQGTGNLPDAEPFDAEELLRLDTPFLDVRAPAEATRGSVPGAVNLPLLDDEERRRVGTTYKLKGHGAAVAMGHELVSGAVRREREAAWCAFVRDNPGAWIFCWRGGQRSAIAQQWLTALGCPLPRVPGGFKALRHVCLGVLERAPADKPWCVLGGRTGSGKTDLLRTLPNAIDLEGMAAHRGSAFGAREIPQPSPVTFENSLAVAFLRHEHRTLVVEDESRTIGRLALPEGWHHRMQEAPLAVLTVPMEHRLANIVREYVRDPVRRGVTESDLHARYSDALRRISRRLGGVRHQQVQRALDRGFTRDDHDHWVRLLLEWYYDPMYDYQLARKHGRIVVEGDAATVRTALSEM